MTPGTRGCPRHKQVLYVYLHTDYICTLYIVHAYTNAYALPVIIAIEVKSSMIVCQGFFQEFSDGGKTSVKE